MLSPDQSDTLRRLINNCLLEINRRESDLAAQAAPWISRSTLNRLLKKDKCISIDQAHVLMHLASNLVGLSAREFQQVLENQICCCRGTAELAHATCLSAASDDIDALVGRFDEAAARSHALLGYYRVLPPFALDESVMDKVMAHRAASLAADARGAYTLLRERAAQQREDFMNRGTLGSLRRIHLNMTLSSLVKMVMLEPPYATCSRDEINMALESLIVDCVEHRGVTMAIANDIVEGPARNWAWSWSRTASVTFFDCGMAIKRRCGTLVFRVLSAAEGCAAGALIDDCRRSLMEWPNFRCHGLSQPEIIEFLKKFLFASGHRPRFGFWLN